MRTRDRERDPIGRPLAASVALHVVVAVLMLVKWPWTKELKIGTAVPVNIVTNAPTTDLRPAVEAPEDQAAAVEEPVPEAPLQPPAPPTPEPEPTPKPTPTPPKPTPPTPKPTPTPPKPAPTPKPTPKPAPKPPEKAPPQKAQPQKEVDLDKLLASVTKGGRPSGAQQSSAAKGPSRPETASQARPAAGSGLAANQLRGLADELQRRWNPNCDVEGGKDVQVKVTFALGFGGQVVGEVSANGAERSPSPVVQAAADRAIRAVYAASPFRNLPRDFYGQRISVNFNAREACA
jgi:protein TonB